MVIVLFSIWIIIKTMFDYRSLKTHCSGVHARKTIFGCKRCRWKFSGRDFFHCQGRQSQTSFWLLQGRWGETGFKATSVKLHHVGVISESSLQVTAHGTYSSEIASCVSVAATYFLPLLQKWGGRTIILIEMYVLPVSAPAQCLLRCESYKLHRSSICSPVHIYSPYFNLHPTLTSCP